MGGVQRGYFESVEDYLEWADYVCWNCDNCGKAADIIKFTAKRGDGIPYCWPCFEPMYDYNDIEALYVLSCDYCGVTAIANTLVRGMWRLVCDFCLSDSTR